MVLCRRWGRLCGSFSKIKSEVCSYKWTTCVSLARPLAEKKHFLCKLINRLLPKIIAFHVACIIQVERLSNLNLCRRLYIKSHPKSLSPATRSQMRARTHTQRERQELHADLHNLTTDRFCLLCELCFFCPVLIFLNSEYHI